MTDPSTIDGFDLEIDGVSAPDSVRRAACGAFVRQVLNAPALAEVTFAEPDPETVALLAVGRPLRLGRLGGGELFNGEITAVEHSAYSVGGQIVRIRAYDALHRLRKRQRTRALTDVDIALVAAEAGDAMGVQTRCQTSGPRRDLVIQQQQNDLEFLVQFAAESGRSVCLHDQTLSVFCPAGDGQPAVVLTMGRQLLEATACTSAETVRRSTRVMAWDSKHAISVAGEARAREGAFGPAFAGLGDRILVNRLASDSAEAEALAQADIDRAGVREKVLNAVALGDPNLRPGRAVDIEGLGGGDGRYVLTEAVHRFETARGYLVELSSAPPSPPPPSKAASATIGRVLDADDPEALSRVRAVLPAFGDVETGWMPVVCAGAGPRKGAMILPERDDDVLILFPDGDASRGLVLGGLYNAVSLPGRPATALRDIALRSSGGQALTLEGAGSATRLETRGGDVLELKPDGSRLTSVGDLVIEAPGRTLTIRAAAVAFERG